MNINSTNYEEYLIRKLEGLLSQKELEELDRFMLKHPELLNEWEALKQTVLLADEELIFSNKASLKKPEQERKAIPLYRNIAIAGSVAATLLFVVYMGVFRFNNTDKPPTIASIQTPTQALPSVNKASRIPVRTPTNSTPFVEQNTAVNSTHALYHHHTFPNTASQPATDETPNIPPSVRVEMVRLIAAPVNAIPIRTNNPFLAPYKSIESTQSTTANNFQQVRTAQHAPLVQFASVVGAELYRLSGRGELPVGKQQLPARNDLSISVKTKRFSFLKTFHSHSNQKSI